MTVENVIFISDAQYNAFQVVAMYNLIMGNTQHPEQPDSADTAYSFLDHYLQKMRLTNLQSSEAPKPGVGASEEVSELSSRSREQTRDGWRHPSD